MPLPGVPEKYWRNLIRELQVEYFHLEGELAPMEQK